MRYGISRMRAVLAALLLGLALALGWTAPGIAQDGHEGHNHGDEGPATPIPVNPRGVTETQAFQLAAVVVRNQLLIFLDNPDSNEPVSDASIEMTADNRTIALSPRGDGIYVAEGWRPRTGHNALMFFVDSAGTADLLSIALDMPAAASAEAPAAPGGRGSKLTILLAVPAALLLGVLVSVTVTRATRRRRGAVAEAAGAPAEAMTGFVQT